MTSKPGPMLAEEHGVRIVKVSLVAILGGGAVVRSGGELEGAGTSGSEGRVARVPDNEAGGLLGEVVGEGKICES